MATFAFDLQHRLPGWSPQCIFDVGANIGQSALTFRHAYPDATIYSFEPVSSSFAALKSATEKLNVSCHRVGLGAKSGTALITAKEESKGNRIVATDPGKGPVETIPITTGDEFCAENGVEQISFVKIDTEGRDLDVLVGFKSMLEKSAIDFVQAEVGMNSTNTRHAPFHEVSDFLRPMGYDLFSIYDQIFEYDGKPLLRRCNPVFIAKRLVAPGLAIPRPTKAQK